MTDYKKYDDDGFLNGYIHPITNEPLYEDSQPHDILIQRPHIDKVPNDPLPKTLLLYSVLGFLFIIFGLLLTFEVYDPATETLRVVSLYEASMLSYFFPAIILIIGLIMHARRKN